MLGRDVEPTDSSPDPVWHTEGRPSALLEPSLPSPAKSGEYISPSGPLWALVTGYAALAVGLLVLIGWAFDIPTLKSVLPGAMTMKPNTAVSVLALGLAMIAAVVPKPPYVPSR